MSASTASKTGNSARSAGTGIPDCAINASSPSVFRATVFPPVLGPLITSCRCAPSSSSEIGTTLAPPAAFARSVRSSSGWRALRTIKVSARCCAGSGDARGVFQKAHRHAAVFLGEAGFGKLQFQLGDAARRTAAMAWLCSPMRAVISRRMRWISACSSSSRRTSSLFCSMVSSGSTKTVCPLELAPCTTPCTRRLCSDLMGMTKRSPRMVISSSCSVPPSASRRR